MIYYIGLAFLVGMLCGLLIAFLLFNILTDWKHL